MPNSSTAHQVRSASPDDTHKISDLLDLSLGPGRHTRAAARVRESADECAALALVIELDDRIIATCSCSHVLIGEEEALLLGPLAVSPDLKNKGWGKMLLSETIDKARELGFLSICLVGDEDYYSRVGFKRVPKGQITFDHPVDPNRILIKALSDSDGAAVTGAVRGVRVST